MAPDFMDAKFWQVANQQIGVQTRKMAFVCSKGNLDMAYPALVMGIAALSEKVDVNLFFTFWGLDIITKRTMDHLKFTMQGNTAMHMPFLEKLRPGWGKRYLSPSLGNIPGMTHFATRYLMKEMDKNGIPPVRDLLEQINEMGGHLYACQMSMDLMGLRKNMLFREVEAVITAPEFVRKSEGAQIIFI
ncbi:MAG: DsrE/DsrF/DrsH-like family protein [Mobiluncus porci]|nr:DsrE/DsrF/DrsH-like family protein [Mobiluncus porci]MDD7541345.1 DsrE/DsrF/DrsH-like family protein [Mobiluncus porci]MDY5747828.1 DsrE/DsrF/DrsH-like family protein [Mobiluncus porci]